MKILAIDGMTSPQIVWNALVKPMADKYKAQAVYSQWQGWREFCGVNWDVIVGHSLGGDSAVQLCEWLKANGGQQPGLLMTLGARHQSLASWLDCLLPFTTLQRFTAPNAVTHNFWTYGPFPSEAMDGAAENTRIGLPYWHGSIPYAPAVQSCLENFLKDGK